MNAEEYQKYKQEQIEISKFRSSVEEVEKNESQKTERQQYLKSIQPKPEVFSKPIREAPPIPKDMETQWGTEQPQTVVVGAIDAPPSIYGDLNGKTYLTKILEIKNDDIDTHLIDKFVQEKMRVGKLKDNQENYERVFNNLLHRANLSIRQNKEYVLQRLGIYLKNKQQYEDDDIIMTLIKGRHPNGKRASR